MRYVRHVAFFDPHTDRFCFPDTQFYWNLTQHIFRYNHYGTSNSSDDPTGNIHTVNECKIVGFGFAMRTEKELSVIELDGFVGMIRFFVTLILNVDETDSM